MNGSQFVRRDTDDLSFWGDPIQYLFDFGGLQMVFRANENEVAIGGKQADDMLDDRLSFDLDEWLDFLVAGALKARATARHGNDDLHRIFGDLRPKIGWRALPIFRRKEHRP